MAAPAAPSVAQMCYADAICSVGFLDLAQLRPRARSWLAACFKLKGGGQAVEQHLERAAATAREREKIERAQRSR
jgi:hypothetical protein